MHKVGTSAGQPTDGGTCTHTRAHTYSQLLQGGDWFPVPGHRLPGPGELCSGHVEEAQLGLETLEWEEGRESEGGRLGSHILDLWSVSAVPDLVLWVSVRLWVSLSLMSGYWHHSFSLLGLGLGG